MLCVSRAKRRIGLRSVTSPRLPACGPAPSSVAWRAVGSADPIPFPRSAAVVPITRFAVAVALVAVAAPAGRAADITDPADLFPPGTLAYAEVHDPAAV